MRNKTGATKANRNRNLGRIERFFAKALGWAIMLALAGIPVALAVKFIMVVIGL